MDMKCIYCGSKWKEDKTKKITVCPFCSLPLDQDNNAVAASLRWIVNERGVDVFKNASLINALLADVSNDKEKDRQKVSLALSTGAGTLFLDIFKRGNGKISASAAGKFQDFLESNGFTPDFSKYILNTFLYAVSLPLKKETPEPPKGPGRKNPSGATKSSKTTGSAALPGAGKNTEQRAQSGSSFIKAGETATGNNSPGNKANIKANNKTAAKKNNHGGCCVFFIVAIVLVIVIVIISETGRSSGNSESQSETAGTSAITFVPKDADIGAFEGLFPDEYFRSILTDRGVDQNGDGILQKSEAEAVTEISIDRDDYYQYGFEDLDLSGINYFENLESLTIADIGLTTLDVSENTRLTYLYCNYNSLTSLDVSKNTELTTLSCNDNNLTALNVSSNTELTSLYCAGNPLMSLDLTNNPYLNSSNVFADDDVRIIYNSSAASAYDYCKNLEAEYGNFAVAQGSSPVDMGDYYECTVSVYSGDYDDDTQEPILLGETKVRIRSDAKVLWRTDANESLIPFEEYPLKDHVRIWGPYNRKYDSDGSQDYMIFYDENGYITQFYDGAFQ